MLALATLFASPAARAVDVEVRVKHAQELMGKRYKRTIASIKQAEEQHIDFRSFIEEQVRGNLPKAYKKKAKKVTKAIFEASERYEFDPVFLMAVIQNESSFNPKAKGPVGEIGLMQLRPETAKWVNQKLKLKARVSHKALEEPINNIRIGAAYLNMLRDRFDSHGRLYLAAYNMGVSNVNRKLKANTWPKEYPVRVMKRYMSFYKSLKAEIKAAKEKLFAVTQESDQKS